ncbi:hypothetical protein FRACYDRAFT_245383 [Fragilariopsis cylindrus CCMP1102]|uniref:Uncharacterized protein n=1 Tax=Fragilariopsis cylindrus CCMP1102 TaxID=635003 RepID=A0A1E7EZP6_9STRA|nr:hypothetical protein FRACYDRAFT_245383 [Fragilariopsis cylindrus CCMP1102]|eukprot:OEU11490.1 hypothetical protein FRACYDRAFT_245383 [Fragilariopsis cylindrus CCMP1102]
MKSVIHMEVEQMSMSTFEPLMRYICIEANTLITIGCHTAVIIRSDFFVILVPGACIVVNGSSSNSCDSSSRRKRIGLTIVITENITVIFIIYVIIIIIIIGFHTMKAIRNFPLAGRTDSSSRSSTGHIRKD